MYTFKSLIKLQDCLWEESFINQSQMTYFHLLYQSQILVASGSREILYCAVFAISCGVIDALGITIVGDWLTAGGEACCIARLLDRRKQRRYWHQLTVSQVSCCPTLRIDIVGTGVHRAWTCRVAVSFQKCTIGLTVIDSMLGLNDLGPQAISVAILALHVVSSSVGSSAGADRSLILAPAWTESDCYGVFRQHGVQLLACPVGLTWSSRKQKA